MSTLLPRTNFCLFPLPFSGAHFRLTDFKFSCVGSSYYQSSLEHALIRHRCGLIVKPLCMRIISSPDINQILHHEAGREWNLAPVWLQKKTQHESLIGICRCQAMRIAGWEWQGAQPRHLRESTATAAEVKGFKAVNERQATELQINYLYHFKSWDI